MSNVSFEQLHLLPRVVVLLVLLWNGFVLYSNVIWAFLAPESSLLPLNYGDTAVCVVGSGLD